MPVPGLRAAPNPAVVGQWSAPVEIGIMGMHATLLHTGQVLLYEHTGDLGSEARLLDPSTNEAVDVTVQDLLDIHCSANTVTPDGRVLIVGGTEYGNRASHNGVTTAMLFDPETWTWAATGPLNDPRWYPTAVQLGNGRTLVAAGEMSLDVPQISAESYDPGTGLSTEYGVTADSDTDPYAHLFLLPSGKVFRAIPNPDAQRFNTATGTWSSRFARMNFGWRDGGAAVLLPGPRVLAVGGADLPFADRSPDMVATATAEIIDFAESSPAWRYTQPMHFPRIHPNLVLLADGRPLVVGGAAQGFSTSPVRRPELFSPWNGSWTLMAAQAADRGYHSTALLLPDGRVLSTGSNLSNLPTTVEYFSPPYLFKGSRPVIESAPTSVAYGQQMTIVTPDAGDITRVVLVRPGSTTHATNFDQRWMKLSFTRGTGSLIADIPSSPTRLPPGYYMLFILSSQGVPSVAPFVHVG